MSDNDGRQEESSFRWSPTGPHIAPRSAASQPAAARPNLPIGRRLFWPVVIFALLLSGVAIRAYRDLSQPGTWAYWKDQYLSPSLSSTLIGNGEGQDKRRGLAVSGKIGPAAATWFRATLDEARLAPGDVIVLSSPGGSINQAIIMGEEIRSRGLTTAVGVADGPGTVQPGYCASACVFVYAGGTTRYGVEGSRLGVHRFVNESPVPDPVAETQRVAGMILGYMTRMGVSSSILETMSRTEDVHWLDTSQAIAMNLITAPVGRR